MSRVLIIDECLILRKKTHVQVICPFCHCDVTDDTSDTFCELHRVIKLQSQMKDLSNTKETVISKLKSTFSKLEEWNEYDKVTFLEYLCNVNRWHTIQFLRKEDIYMNDQNVPFTTVDYNEFCKWFHDKMKRMDKNDHNFRYRATMKLRKLYLSNPEHRKLVSKIEIALNATEPFAALESNLRKQIFGCEKAIAGLNDCLNSNQIDEAGKRKERISKLNDKIALKFDLEQQLVNLQSNVVFDEMRSLQKQLSDLENETGIKKILDSLDQYNNNLQSIRSNNGHHFEAECLPFTTSKFAEEPDVKLLQGVSLPNTVLPERATGEFDFVAIDNDGKVRDVIEIKRGCSMVRGNVLKKIRAFSHLASDQFNGAEFKGTHFAPGSFEYLDPMNDNFYDHMWYITKPATVVSDKEDVWGMNFDNENAFLDAVITVLDHPIGSEEFLKKSFEFIKDKYVITEDDMKDYWVGREAFFKLVQKKKIILIDHLVKPEDLGLPMRHKAFVKHPEI